MRLHATLLICALALSSMAVAGTPATAFVASEGCHAVYTGRANGADLRLVAFSASSPLEDELGGLRPARHEFDLPDGHCVFIAVWGVGDPQRGVIAEVLVGGIPVYSGESAWQSFACRARRCCGDEPPNELELADEVLAATQASLWTSAIKLALNGLRPGGLVAGLSKSAAWMWRPGIDRDVRDDGACQQVSLFRMCPNESWPEIELNHGRNVGVSNAGGRFDAGAVGSRLPFGGGGGGVSGSPGGLGGGGGSGVGDVPNPFLPDNPSGVVDRPAQSPPEGLRSNPQVPVRDRTPVSSTDTNDQITPPRDTSSTTVERPKPPVTPPPPPPVIPEPASLVLLAVLGLGLRRARV